MRGGAPAEADLKRRAELLPDQPGVYLFLDAAGRVIYVGKAASLRDRVRSYFRGQQPARTARLMREAAGLDHIVTGTEVEALILECNLIKRHRPRFNVRLRDDKNYPYLRVGTGEEWPRVTVVRRPQGDGARYFGPYAQAGSLYETLRTLRAAFPFRTCSDARFRQHRERPCLHYFIGRCPGPCAGRCTPEAYREQIRQLVQFLEGRQGALLRRLRREMGEAAERLDFERAARLRDRLRALERVVQRQRVVSDRLRDHDVVALARAGEGEEETACVQVFFVRQGQVVGREAFLLSQTAGTPDGEVLSAFLKQYYSRATAVPREVVLSAPVEDAAAIAAWLGERRGGAVALTVPRRGAKRELVELVARNAALFLEEEGRERERAAEAQGLEELQRLLGLAVPPRRIEGYDVSNTQGREAVVSMVVFVDGRPAPGEYRRFRVRAVAGPDDYAMLREALERRFRHAGAAGADPSFGRLPDLVLVDGGRGQVSAATAALAAAGAGPLPVCGLAKEEELIHLPDRPRPLALPGRSPALRLLQRVRDEAHRYALSHHRRLRTRAALHSVLEEVPGIGPRRRRALLGRFPSLAALAQATEEELASVPGMNRALARALKEHLRPGV